jgi:hypothetical protein
MLGCLLKRLCYPHIFSILIVVWVLIKKYKQKKNIDENTAKIQQIKNCIGLHLHNDVPEPNQIPNQTKQNAQTV